MLLEISVTVLCQRTTTAEQLWQRWMAPMKRDISWFIASTLIQIGICIEILRLTC